MNIPYEMGPWEMALVIGIWTLNILILAAVLSNPLAIKRLGQIVAVGVLFVGVGAAYWAYRTDFKWSEAEQMAQHMMEPQQPDAEVVPQGGR